MAEDVSRSIARVVAAQLAESVGFDACQDSAIEILADILLRYISTVCASSHGYAELAGRSQSNLADVLLALEELGVAADDLHQHMQLQGTDVPFAHTLAPYPVHIQQPLPPTFADQREPVPAHIPNFLPAFPDPHTYQHTAAFAGHEGDPYKQRQSMLEAKQKAEAALNKLHQRMTSKVTLAQPDVNPFLVPPAVEQLPAELPIQQPTAAAVPAAAAGLAADSTNGSTIGANIPSAVDQVAQALPVMKQLQQHLPTQQQGEADSTDEDALFEVAAVVKAFNGVLGPELLAKHTRNTSGQQQTQQQQGGQQAADAVIVQQDNMDTDGVSVQPAHQYLAWQEQVQPPQSDTQGVGGVQLLRFGIGPSGASKRAALSLARRHRPADVYAENVASMASVGGGSGSRQRKSRYDADPKVVQAQGILAAGPEAVFSTVGGAMHSMFESGEALE